VSCDIVLVGVGGQGILTIGDLLLRAAFAADVPASFCPSKGMAQRGGFVKVEIRLGRANVGPRIGERKADLVVAMERSEALKGLHYVKPEGTFVLYDHVWEPAGAQLGIDEYPSLEQVIDPIRATAARTVVLTPADLPSVDGRQVHPNVFVLGAMLGVAQLADVLEPGAVEQIVADRWPNASESNLKAFRFGLSSCSPPEGELQVGEQ
jgi:indolepyruvate ferredoxin oxidoreductase beta subunit